MFDWQVKACGQKDLEDDGKRDLDEEICNQLDSKYENWRNPKTTYMVPRDFISKMHNPDIGEITEEEFFNLLQTFGKRQGEPMFVIHSYKFCECIHEWESGFKKLQKWVMGEHDFVAVHRDHGVLFFQVKATKTIGNHQKAQEQIRKDKISLMKFFERMVKAGKISKKKADKVFNNFPAFAVLPNSRRGDSVCTQDNFIYQEDCASVEAFSVWWEKFITNTEHPEINQTIFDFLVMRFVGMVYVGPLLGDCVDCTLNTLIFKTKDQVEILAGHYPPKLWIRGPAGSGKTVLLLEKVETLASDILGRQIDENILVLCFNSALCKMLEKTLNARLAKRFPAEKDVSSLLHFKTFAKLIMKVTGLSQPPSSNNEKERAVSMALKQLLERTSPFYRKYDHIFVDEGQDLYGPSKWPELLEQMHKSSVVDHNKDAELEVLQKSGFFWVMFDINQYLYFSKERLQSLAAYLKNSAQLNKVLRNTGNIFEQSKKYFRSLMPQGSAIKLGHHESGLQIKWDDSLASTDVEEEEGVQAIVPHLTDLLRQKVRARDICVLVQNQTKQGKLMDALPIKTQTADQLVTENDDFMVVESIRRFKGLESKVVILYNPPFEDISSNKEMLYTAVSRCFCYLIVITTPGGCKALQSIQGIQGTSKQYNPTHPEFYRKRPNEERGESERVFFPVDNLSREDENNQAYWPSVPKQAKNSEPSPMEVDE